MSSPLYVAIPIYEIQVKNPETGEMESLRKHEEIIAYLGTREALERFPGLRAARQLAHPRGQAAAGLEGEPTLNILPAMSLIGLARQRINGEFYASGAPVCLALDADVFVGPDVVGRMYHAITKGGADVVMCAYPGRTPPHQWFVGTLKGKDGKADIASAPRRIVEGHPSGPFRLIQILGGGFGCVMYSRRVYETMAAKFPELGYIAIPEIIDVIERFKTIPPDDVERMATMDAKFSDGSPRLEFAFFTPEVRRLPGSWRTFIGEDYAFFYRLQEAGLRCELMPDADIVHDRYRGNFARELEGRP